MSPHILDNVRGWRAEDYDGYNDYYVNPEFSRVELLVKLYEENVEYADFSKLEE